jgi:hypothetical protein
MSATFYSRYEPYERDAALCRTRPKLSLQCRRSARWLDPLFPLFNYSERCVRFASIDSFALINLQSIFIRYIASVDAIASRA